jgi:hypothetical protein
MKRLGFGDVLKICKSGFSGAKDFLHTTGIQVSAYIFRLPHEPPFRRTNGADGEVYFLKLNLVCCLTDSHQ